MKTIEIISQDVFDKIRSRFTNLQMGDEDGGVTMDPRQARFFDFDFAIEGNNLGRVSISINELGTLKVFYGKSLLEDSDTISRDYWYDFLREMRMFAKRRLLRFDTRDITKSNLNKDDFQYLASTGTKDETMNMSESVKFKGTPKTSYGVLEQTKIIVKHKKPIEDESFGARSRKNNMEAIFIENELGERYKMPVLWLPGAKAMQMHCAHGGKPWDELGESINGICKQVAELASFKRHATHDSMNKEASEILERANAKMENLKHQAHKLATRQGYREWSESFDPQSTMQGTVEMDQATLEDYKSKFTVSSFKEDLAQFFPLIHSIMQEAGTIDLEDYVKEGDEEECTECGMYESKCTCDDEVKEGMFTQFTDWADALAEGRIEPDTLAELKKLLDSELTLGVDGTSAIEALQGIGIHDDDLANALEELSKISPEADPKATIGAWLAKEDPEAAQEFGLAPTTTSPDIVPDQTGTVDNPTPPQPNQLASEQPIDESAEDRTSYQVARYLFDKGARYNPNDEKHTISLIGGAMMKLGMDHKTIRYLMNYDEDFLSDTLSELRSMEKAVDEVAMESDQKAGIEKELNKGDKGKKPSIKELAQWIGGHYNQNYQEEGFKSGFRKGPTELGVMASKEFGPEYGEIVERMVSDMDDTPLQRVTRNADYRRAEEADEMQSGQLSVIHGEESQPNEDFVRIMKLAGLAK